MKKQDNIGDYKRMVDYFASCGLHKYEDIADDYVRAYVYPSLMVLGREVEEFDEDLKKANEKLNKEIEAEANRIRNQEIKIKAKVISNDSCNKFEEEINKVLEELGDNFIDIQSSVSQSQGTYSLTRTYMAIVKYK